jgi:tRNA threonylcarbamoyl adenosine modification protein YeaZ
VLILAIDTSAAASVALVDGETVVAQRTEFSARRHVEYVGPALTQVLGAGGRPDVVAVGVGPGPFTGLRAGIAAGIGAAVGADVPVHGVVSHDALALRTLAGADSPSSPVLVATDARRREVYASLYTGLDDDGLPIVQAGPAVLAPAAVEDWLRETAPGSSPVREGRGFALQPEALDPTAGWVARVAHRALTAGRTLPGTEPLYLREPDAAPTPRRSTPLT